MADYRNYTVENFLTDTLFRAWVLNDDPDAEAFWRFWMTANPDRTEPVQQARALLLAIAEKKRTVSDEQLDQIVEDTLGKLSNESETDRPAGRRLYLVLARVAAALLLVTGLGWYVYRLQNGAPSRIISSAPAEIRVERRNETNRPMTVLLGDKSTVILQPGSRLSFSKEMGKAAKRVVYLDGEAFFDVVKDPAHPFFVYTNHLITKVLGTSFRVVSFNREEQASVSVVTGRVTVFPQSNLAEADKMTPRPGSGEVVLSPNEQATFNQNKAGLTKSRVHGTAGLYHPPHFSFDETPVTEVFAALEEEYDIDIQYDPEKMKGYLLTATFSEMSLHDELHLICRIIKGNYQIEDGRVIIETDQ